MRRHDSTTRLLALAMAAVMTAGAALPVLAAPIGSGVTPSYDEAYYATLDYYGNLMEGSVVKSYTLNGAGTITDYGVYDEVVNLTDASPASQEKDCTVFKPGQALEHFYFEGKTAQPFQDLPWTITLRYTLNGVPVQAEELAGKTGVAEIQLDLVPNEKASDYARYNYTLEAMAVFNQDDILSLEAPGAQVQLVGNLRAVLFLALPGEERHFTIRVGSNAFSFGGMTFLLAPATLAQLEEIAKLSQRKDDLEEDYEALSGSLDNLLDALSSIQSGLYASASGLDQLNTARGTISGGKDVLYEDAGALREDLTGIADQLEPVQERVQLLSQTITESKAVLGEMADTATSLKAQLDSLEQALAGLEHGAGDLKQVLQDAADMKDSLAKLQKALEKAEITSQIKISSISVPSISTGGGSVSATGTVEQVKQVHAVYASAGNDDAFITGMLTLQQGSAPSAETAAGVKQLQGLTEEQFDAALATGAIAGVTKEDWQSAQALQQLHAGVQGGRRCQSFCASLPGISASQAKQMDDLWQIYDSGGDAAVDLIAGGLDQASGALDSTMSSINSSVSDVVGDVNQSLKSVNRQIDDLLKELNSLLKDIARPTADVVGKLSGICGELDELAALTDDAADLAAALRQAAPKLSSILDEADQLRAILDGYEPTLQEGLANAGVLSASAVAALRSLETLLGDTEELMQASGRQLDAGAKQTLSGLSDALRRTAQALAATGDVRDAKDTISHIIEDTWEEYTGSVNNILRMDAGAEAVSLTDSRNPAPSSIQILIRTQEIKAEEAAAAAAEAAPPKEKSTFWGRVAQMFADFWNALTGLFR